MPLFLSEEELQLLGGDVAAVAERADDIIRDLRLQLDTIRAETDAASIAAEQACALLEQRYASLSADLSRLQAENAALSASLELRASELATAEAANHALRLKAIEKDGEIERLTLEVSELHKSKRQLLELLELKDTEISEKNATIKSFLDKIVLLTDNDNLKEARLRECEAELARCLATCDRLTQEKELIEKHNHWLNEELTAKVDSFMEYRRTQMELEADLSARIADLERESNESSTLYKRSKDRMLELEQRVSSLEEDLRSSRDAAAANEERFAAELCTVSKLVELYKASSEEWSKKAGELEGVIKALEAHLSQVEGDWKEKLDKEVSIKKEFEKEALDLKEKIKKCEDELEKTQKATDLSLTPLSSFQAASNMEDLSMVVIGAEKSNENYNMIVPQIPAGISGTALAASLLRDGWSLAKMYEKYQETADALRHEQWGRRHAEVILERVLHEIEEKAELILDERAEHERMMEAYTVMNHKLQQALLEHDKFESTIRNLKVELKAKDREYSVAQKDINDLQKQVAFLLKECQDVQIRCGTTSQVYTEVSCNARLVDNADDLDAEKFFSEHLLNFKDISGLVEQNVQLRRLVRSLSVEEERRNAELRENFQMELENATNEAALKVEAVLKRSEEQGRMIESLHSAVGMYRRLYEEERKNRSSSHHSIQAAPVNGKDELIVVHEGSQEISKEAYDQLSVHSHKLEEEVARLRSETMSLKLERDKQALEAKFARERLDSTIKEVEIQRQEANGVSTRNIEMTNLIVEYQKRLRESSESQHAVEEKSRQLSMEVSILKHEKEILKKSEKNASDEVRSLTERIFRLQSSLDTIQSTEEVRENGRAIERRRLEEYIKRVEREWAEAKKELQEERDRTRAITLEREKDLDNSFKQLEDMRKELADAWRAVASAESRAAVSEARCSDFERRFNRTEKKLSGDSGDGTAVISNEEMGELWKAKEEIEKLKEEARANKDYMLQYKEIAYTNETALKQIESAHENYKAETDRLKMSLEAEVLSLRNKISDFESNYILKSEEATSAIEAKERALSDAMSETLALREEISEKVRRIASLEAQISSLQDDLDREHKRWQTAQDNYERQVILQSETIQELTNTSKQLSKLQIELSKLRGMSEAQKSENEMLNALWEKDKSALQESKDEAERKYNELNEQNRILHNRLESLHIRLAEKEHLSTGVSLQNAESQGDNLQNVISYLRRSKEIAETEISLLRQEKLRLQSQVDNALKVAERAESLLNTQRASTQAMTLKDEEFKSLQTQVREINLLRESNLQLREENKHNFEESQKFREEAQKAKLEFENLHNLLTEKQIELDSCQKMVEMKDMEIDHLRKRIAELIEACKNIDVEEYERMKDEVKHLKEQLSKSEVDLEQARKIAAEKQEIMLKMEQDLLRCQLDLAEQEKKINDILQTDANIKSENEKQKKVLSHLKKKNETLTKDKDELSKDNQFLQKQIEDLKSSKRMAENLEKEKEKDARIQILEKTLERERAKRSKNESLVERLIDNVNKDKKKLEEELERHRNAVSDVLQKTKMSTSEVPSGSALDEQTCVYFEIVETFLDVANSTRNDPASQPFVPETLNADTSMPTAGSQVPSQHLKASTPDVKGVGEKEKGSTMPKRNVEARKAVRRLVRPRLEGSEESPVEVEMSSIEGSATADEGKAGLSFEVEVSGDTSQMHQPCSTRKRPAASSVLELTEKSVAQDEGGPDTSPPLKRTKDSETLSECGEGQNILLPLETSDLVQQPHLSDNTDVQQPLEGVEADNAPFLSTDDIVNITKNEDVDIIVREEIEKQNMIPSGGLNEEDEVHYEADTVQEEFSDKRKEITELVDESLRTEENDTPMSEGDIGREEGELMPDESEQLQEDVSVEGHQEPVSGEGKFGDEAGEIVEVALVGVLNEKSENTDVVEEAAEGSDKLDDNNGDHGSDISAQTSMAITREGSPSSLSHSTVVEHQSPSVAAVSEEPRTGRTITLAVRARENAQKREQARMRAAQLTPRGRGRAPGTYRRDGNRGTRGGRATRGQGFGDREQS